jgi:hypothetical protein
MLTNEWKLMPLGTAITGMSEAINGRGSRLGITMNESE